jgi:PAS domain S-box-containing protein
MGKNRRFGDYLKQLLKSRYIKPYEIADRLNVDHSLVRKWLAGSRTPPLKSNYCDLLCKYLNLDLNERFLLRRAQVCSIDENIDRLADLQRAEDQAEDYKQAHISLLNTIPEAAFLLDCHGRIVAANEITARRLGITKAELIGQDAFSQLPPDVAEHRKKWVERVFNTGQPIKFKGYRDGCCILNSLYPVKNYEGVITKIAIYETDITELEASYTSLRESEERLRQLFENILDPILLTKPDGTILTANPAACSFFQMTEDEICTVGRGGLIDLKDRNLAAGLIERHAIGSTRTQLTFIAKNGTKKTARVTSVKFSDSTGNLRAYLMIHPD